MVERTAALFFRLRSEAAAARAAQGRAANRESLASDDPVLDTTTKPAVDSLSPRRRSGEWVRERGLQKSATIRWNEPLSPALSPLVPRREREQEGSDGGCIKMRRVAAAPCQVT